MKHVLLYCLLTLLLWGRPAWAQLKQDQPKYEYAKELMQGQKYEQALEVLLRLSVQEPADDFYASAYYMRALAQYHIGKKQEAREAIFRLISEKPGWSGINDAYFLMGMMQFEAGQAESAITSLGKINDKSFNNDIYALKKQMIKDYSVAQLKLLYSTFPADEAVGRVLLGKVYEEGHWDQELGLIQNLEELYNTKPLVAAPTAPKSSKFKVAFLLPFQEEKLDPRGTTPNFVIDTYEGMLLALDELAAQGIVVEHFDYDTKRDSLTTARILNNPDLQKMDLIVGPLYANTIPLVRAFCERHKIPMLNPISDNSDLLASSVAFLSGPSEKTQAVEAANYVFNQARTVNAYAIYGNGPKEEQMAKAFQEAFESKGGRVKGTIALGYDEHGYKNLQKALSGLPSGGPTFVFVAADDLTAANNIISAVQNIMGVSTSATILAPLKWLEYKQLSLARLEGAGMHFYSPMFIDEHSPSVEAWDKRYMEVTKGIPSRFSYLGYKAMYNAGQVLQTTQGKWLEKIHIMGPYKGAWQDFFYYTANDNTGVSIVKFDGGKLVQVYYSPKR